MSEVERLSVSAVLVDSRGRPCPLPIVDLSRALREAALVELWATDPATRPDLQAFLEATGHRALRTETRPGLFQALVQRA